MRLFKVVPQVVGYQGRKINNYLVLWFGRDFRSSVFGPPLSFGGFALVGGAG